MQFFSRCEWATLPLPGDYHDALIAPILQAYAGFGFISLYIFVTLGQLLQMVLNGWFVEVKMIEGIRYLLGFKDNYIGVVDLLNEGRPPCDLLTISNRNPFCGGLLALEVSLNQRAV